MALLGTDSLRGKEIKNVLDKNPFPLKAMDFYDPDVETEFSKLTEFKGEPKVIRHLENTSLEGLDLVFLASEKKVNRKFGALANKLKFRAIDLSETFNDDEKIPLVVAGVNDTLIRKRKSGLIANPHPVTITLAHLFHPVSRAYGLARALSFVLQPASAHEKDGIEELANQSVAMLNSAAMPKKVFKDQSAFNFLCEMEAAEKGGTHSLEKRIIIEVRRVLGGQAFPLALTIVQAPVFHNYSIMTFLELNKEAGIPDLEKLFDVSPYFKVVCPSPSRPVSSLAVAGKDQIHIGPIRKEESFPNSFWVWAVSDNLTRGSALNALGIAERILSLLPKT